MAELVLDDHFQSFAHKRIRSYLEVYSERGAKHSEALLCSFEVATRLLARALNRPTWTQIIVGHPPLEIVSGHSKLIFHPQPELWGHAWHGVVFLDVEKLENCNDATRIVVILEELIHVMMSV